MRSQPNDLHDARERSVAVEIVPGGFVDIAVALAHHRDDGALEADDVFDERYRTGTADGNRHDARREDDAVAEREDGNELRLGHAR